MTVFMSTCQLNIIFYVNMSIGSLFSYGMIWEKIIQTTCPLSLKVCNRFSSNKLCMILERISTKSAKGSGKFQI